MEPYADFVGKFTEVIKRQIRDMEVQKLLNKTIAFDNVNGYY